MSDLDHAQARLAYSIIETLLGHTQATQDLIALMAQALDEDTKNALTNTPQWEAYLESRRAMKRAETDLENFTEAMNNLASDE
jgi:hypothetical protein